MIRKLMVSAFALALMAIPLRAAEKVPQPVEVEANEMEIIDADKQAVFRGQVDAVRGDQHIRSDVMTVFYADAKQADGTSKSEVSKLDATGNVTVTTPKQVITGDWAKMDVTANTLVVGGKVKVVEGKTTLQGERLNVDLNTNRTLMVGGGKVRAKASFVPK
ncbi:MAG: LptA/OstA family protein [Aestuariivirga sp.]|jgi:lipopolysaccharide export system protein LptA